jgi:hypothetical protein
LATPRHGAFYKAISLRGGAGGVAPAESVTEEQVQEACARYGVELLGPLPE